MINLTGEWTDPEGMFYYIEHSGETFEVKFDQGEGHQASFFGRLQSGNRIQVGNQGTLLTGAGFQGQIEMQNGAPYRLKFDPLNLPPKLASKSGFEYFKSYFTVWTRYQPEPVAVAQGRLYRNEGKYEFSSIIADRAGTWHDIRGRQKANIHLVVKPELNIGPESARYLHVGLDGSIVSASNTGNLPFDDERNRGYYLEKVYTIISPNSPQVKLEKAADISPEEKGVVTSSTSTTLSWTGSGKVGIGDKGPSGEIGESLGYSETVGESYTRNLLGFTPMPPRVTGGQVVTNDYKLTSVRFGGSGGLKPYSDWADLSDRDRYDSFWDGFGSFWDTTAWSPFKLHGLPDVAKAGLPIISQALFKTDENFRGRVGMYVGINAILRHVWVTGKTKFDTKIQTSSHQLSLNKVVEIDFGLLA